MRPPPLACRAIIALVFLLGANAQGFAQTGNVDQERLQAARLYLETNCVAQGFADAFKLQLPLSDFYMAQFAERLPNDAARQRFSDTFARIQPEIMAKATAWASLPNGSPLSMQGISARWS